MKLTLGPVPYLWSAETWRDYHFRIADEAPVDTVCVGEVVCAKRSGVHARHLDAVIERLRAAGKEVVRSTLALIMDDADRTELRAATEFDGLVEANDIAACALLAGRPHVLGPFVNVYNEGTLAALAARGATRVCLPAELPKESIVALAADSPAELEIQAFGRLPLAISARCYAARNQGRGKDDCGFACERNAEGLDVDTLDGDPFLAVNGTQIQSASVYNLLAELDELRDMGIGRIRLWPMQADMTAVAQAFRDRLDGRLDAEAAEHALTERLGGHRFCNGFYHGREGAAFI